MDVITNDAIEKTAVIADREPQITPLDNLRNERFKIQPRSSSLSELFPPTAEGQGAVPARQDLEAAAAGELTKEIEKDFLDRRQIARISVTNYYRQLLGDARTADTSLPADFGNNAKLVGDVEVEPREDNVVGDYISFVTTNLRGPNDEVYQNRMVTEYRPNLNVAPDQVAHARQLTGNDYLVGKKSPNGSVLPIGTYAMYLDQYGGNVNGGLVTDGFTDYWVIQVSEMVLGFETPP